MNVIRSVKRVALLHVFCVAMLTVLASAQAIAAAATDPTDIPKLRVPKLVKPPTIDGVLLPGEWQGTAGISALVSACPVGGSTPTIAAPIQQVYFYIGYDDKYLYLAMHSPHKEGTYPQARCKSDDDKADWRAVHSSHAFLDSCAWLDAISSTAHGGTRSRGLGA